MNDKIIIGQLNSPMAVLYNNSERKDIRDITYTATVDVVGSELSIDILTSTAEYPYDENSGQVVGGVDFEYIESDDGYIMCTNRQYYNLRLIPYGTPVYYYRNETMVVKAYVQNVVRVGVGTYRINAISAIGLLDTQKHYGGMYNATTFGAVLADIIGETVPYTVDTDVANIAVYSEYLPYDTKRGNMHKWLFAYGVSIRRNANGDMHFSFLSNAVEKTVPDSRVYINGEVDYSALASEVQVTEHSYIALESDETVVEYDNTDGSETANHTVIAFQNAPLHDLETTGTLTIEESNCNYAIISGTGTLSGKKYTHSTRVLTVQAQTQDGEQNVVSVEDCQTITVLNSANVAARLLAYYASKKTVKSAIVLDGENAGDFITTSDPYYETISGFIQNMNVTVSGINKADATIVTDYIPTGGNNYTDARVYTGSGTIDFNALLALYPNKQNDLVQVSLVQGGHGGYTGENGENPYTPFHGVSEIGKGGAGGAGGEGGKVLTVSFHVSDLAQTTLAYSCGAGGASDTEGSPTTLGDWTSADGAVTPNGLANIFTGDLYATSGISGIAGGNGQDRQGNRPIVSYQGDAWQAGTQGAVYSNSRGTAWGGTGGGAAVGANGSNGADGHGDGTGGVVSGNGGKGADGGTGSNAIIYGAGGQGGHGGGGGGGNGNASGEQYRYDYGYSGAGGAGGAGGIGGAGMILVYV